MIAEGLLIMVLGMGAVFLFFALLVQVMKLLGIFVSFLNKKFPEPEMAAKTVTPVSMGGSDASTALAIAAAKRFLS